MTDLWHILLAVLSLFVLMLVLRATVQPRYVWWIVGAVAVCLGILLRAVQ